MLAIEIIHDQNGGQLHLTERPMPPQPMAGEVLIRIAHAGINRADIMQRQGRYPPPAGTTDIPGLEVAGTVVATGSAVAWPKPGMQVCALLTGGGYAQFCTVDASQCLPVMGGMSLAMASALPEALVTVWHNVFERGQLKAGETLLVHGGSSGIGVMAIQMAKLAGARVMVTAGSQEKCDFCQQLGADLAIDYHEQDFVEVVTGYTHSAGVNIILDMVGGDYLERNIRCLSEEGRLLQIAMQHGTRVAFNYLPVMSRRLTLTGSTLRNQPVAAKAALISEVMMRFGADIGQGIQPHIHASFPMAQAAEAHAMMESSVHRGKLVLDIPE